MKFDKTIRRTSGSKQPVLVEKESGKEWSNSFQAIAHLKDTAGVEEGEFSDANLPKTPTCSDVFEEAFKSPKVNRKDKGKGRIGESEERGFSPTV